MQRRCVHRLDECDTCGDEIGHALNAYIKELRLKCYTLLDRATDRRVGLRATIKLAPAVASSRSLEYLDLANNNICGITMHGNGSYDAEGALALADALVATRRLKRLRLSVNNICGMGVVFGDALKKNKSLTQLDMEFRTLIHRCDWPCIWFAAHPHMAIVHLDSNRSYPQRNRRRQLATHSVGCWKRMIVSSRDAFDFIQVMDFSGVRSLVDALAANAALVDVG